MRLGLYGGTFDPVHNGHVWSARAARRQFGLNRVYFLPSGVPPHKAGRVLTPARHRAAMVGAAIKGRPGLRVSRFDMTRRTPAYTVGTVRYFRRRFPGARLFFILGSDSLLEFTRWRRWGEILRDCELLVVHRPPGPRPRMPGALKGRAHWVGRRGLPVSSREIRKRLRGGRPVARWVPFSVRQYIHENNLYPAGE